MSAFRTLVEDSGEGMILADRQGYILYANPAAVRFLGYEPAELVGRRCFELFRPEHVAAARNAFDRCVAHPGRTVQVNADVLHRAGQLRAAAVTLVNRLAQSGVKAVVVYYRDAAGEDHARRELEAQLRQAQKMEAVGRMTGGIAHDFNNILAVIIANAELLATGVAPDATEAHRDLAELRAVAERGAAMIRKLLGFSRNTDLTIVPTDLGRLVTGSQGMLRHVIPEHIRLEVSTAPGGTALCDPGAVEQMLLNLATNARDAMPAGGTVRIDVSPVVVDDDARAHAPWLTPGEFVQVSVSDNGVGMDERTRARALQPFFTTKPQGVGTGLGLAMVYGLVKQQRGFLDLVSAPGKGTTVRLYFPKAASAPERRPRRGRGAAPKGAGATILLIEDDASVQRTVRRVLEHLGYRVVPASDGTEGVAVFGARLSGIDLVLSDMVMPGLTGAQVYEAVTRIRPGVPFLFLSGYQDRPDRTLAVPAGVPVVAKPWTMEKLAYTISEALAAAP